MRTLFPVLAIFTIALFILAFPDGWLLIQIFHRIYTYSQNKNTSFLFFVFCFLGIILTKNAKLFYVYAGTNAKRCSQKDIGVTQAHVGRRPNGIPIYGVQITNLCFPGCSIANIHLSCGWFSSANLINPKIFRRVAYNDCLVNNAEPSQAGRILSFEYTTTYMYHLSVSSATFTC
ncbi:tapetum determinant 1 [Melia azedarach]|uniref:Tapetum determinant 1 n=1 Tax=Melia azedarach TaxID=155640 RepID=A0ACC1X8K6_MELAZ|nr:tapetum determinant 1 [Melia azedarach]